METRVQAITGRWSQQLPLQNYPVELLVTSNWSTLEHVFAKHDAAWFTLGELIETLPSDQQSTFTESLEGAAKTQADVNSVVKNLAVQTLQSMPGLHNLEVRSSEQSWGCALKTTEPCAAYGYVVRNGNVQEVQLNQTSAVTVGLHDEQLHITVHDPDIFALSIESDSSMHLAVAPQMIS